MKKIENIFPRILRCDGTNHIKQKKKKKPRQLLQELIHYGDPLPYLTDNVQTSTII